MLFTLQATAVSEVLETVAVNVSVSPSNTVPILGVMLMVMEGGGGGGGVTEPAPPPPQPRVHAPAVRRTLTIASGRKRGSQFFTANRSLRVCGRGRMKHVKAGEGPANPVREVDGFTHRDSEPHPDKACKSSVLRLTQGDAAESNGAGCGFTQRASRSELE
jgi:hypothetical protein